MRFLDFAGNASKVTNPYAMPPNLSAANKALWKKTEAKNRRYEKTRAARVQEWESERDARLMALQPAGPAPLFDGAKFVALDTIEHSIHQALGSLHQADDEDERECSERFEARVLDHPREGLRYFIERAKARVAENWSEMIAILTIRSKLKGANVAAHAE